MKDRATWILLTVLWCALLAVQLLSWYGMLPFGKVHPAFIIVSGVGVGTSIWHLWLKK